VYSYGEPSEIDVLLNSSEIRIISMFQELCRKNRKKWDFKGPYHRYEFQIDPDYLAKQESQFPGDELTKNMYNTKPLRMSVLLKDGSPTEELERFGETLPDGKIWVHCSIPLPENVSKGHWVVGLTCDERDMLLLHPMVKDVRPFCPIGPRFDISMDFH
jgi:hypothetical protein